MARHDGIERDPGGLGHANHDTSDLDWDLRGGSSFGVSHRRELLGRTAQECVGKTMVFTQWSLCVYYYLLLYYSVCVCVTTATDLDYYV